MEDVNQKILDKLNKIQIDIEFIRENFENDGELSDWAKEELEEARKRPEKDCVSLEEVKKRIFAKK